MRLGISISLITILTLTSCATVDRAPSSLKENSAQTKKIAAVLAFNPQTQASCLLNQDKGNFYSPAIAGSVIAPYSESAKIAEKIPECDAKTNAEYQKVASVSYLDGPQVAGLPVIIGYYLACSAMQVGLDRLDKLSEAEKSSGKQVDHARKVTRSWVYGLGIAASYTVCIPATAINVALIYVYTDRQF